MHDSLLDTIPEKIFLWAILERAIYDAIGDYKVFSTDTPYIQREAMAWIRSDSEEEFSFEWICLHLDIAPELVRKCVKSSMGVKFYKRQSRDTQVFNIINDQTDEVIVSGENLKPRSHMWIDKNYLCFIL
mgnify:CR=1 FL=1